MEVHCQRARPLVELVLRSLRAHCTVGRRERVRVAFGGAEHEGRARTGSDATAPGQRAFRFARPLRSPNASATCSARALLLWRAAAVARSRCCAAPPRAAFPPVTNRNGATTTHLPPRCVSGSERCASRFCCLTVCILVARLWAALRACICWRRWCAKRLPSCASLHFIAFASLANSLSPLTTPSSHPFVHSHSQSAPHALSSPPLLKTRAHPPFLSSTPPLTPLTHHGSHLIRLLRYRPLTNTNISSALSIRENTVAVTPILPRFHLLLTASNKRANRHTIHSTRYAALKLCPTWTFAIAY